MENVWEQFAGLSPPRGFTNVGRMAYEMLVFNAWRDVTLVEAEQRRLQEEARNASVAPFVPEASAPPLEPFNVPQPPSEPNTSPARPRPGRQIDPIDAYAADVAHRMGAPERRRTNSAGPTGRHAATA